MKKLNLPGRRQAAWVLMGSVGIIALILVATGHPVVAAVVLAAVAAVGTALTFDARKRNTHVARNVRLAVTELREVRKQLDDLRQGASVTSSGGVRTASAGGPGGSNDVAAAMELLRSGYFDAEYYTTATGYLTASRNPDPSAMGAALHFLRYGNKAGHSPHPLIEPEYIPASVREHLAMGTSSALVAYLTSDGATTHAWSPVFDPRVALADWQAGSPKPACLFDPYSEGGPLPVPSDFVGTVPTLEQARQAAIANAALTRSQMDAKVPDKRPDWDSATEAAWVLTTGRGALVRTPLVSIIMAAWNREREIVTAIESVLQQTYGDWELVVVDDGSTDATPDIVRRYAASDDRVRLVEGTHGGVSKARNLGLERSRGELIAFLDTDNIWTPRFLELSVKTLEAEPELVGAYSGLRLAGAGSVTYLGGQVSIAELAKGNAVDMNTLVVRAACLDKVGEFDTALRRWVDYDLLLRVAARGSLRYMPFIGCDYFDGQTDNRITSVESHNWQFVPMGKHMVSWGELPTPLSERVSGRVSVVMLAFQEHRKTQISVDRVLKTTEGSDVEVVLVDNGSRPAVSRSLSVRYAHNERVSFHRLARNYNFSIGSNVGYARSTGEHVMFLNNDTEVRDGWLEPLVARLRNSGALGVQPVLVFPNGTIQTAGTVFLDRQGLPVHLLAGHPQEDALRHGGRELSAISAGAMLIRAETFERLRGFDPIFANGYEDIDFCLRAREELGGWFEVEATSRVVHEESQSPGRFARETENQRILLSRWAGLLPSTERRHYRTAGFDVPHLQPSPTHGRALVVRPAVTAEDPVRGTVPRLRWAVKIGADAGAPGDRWGDVPFARDLGDALENLHQDVVIDRYGAFSRPTSYLDDVILTLRGRFPVAHQAGRVNIMWVISRPDLVTPEEVRGYDLVYAASPLWAQHMSELSGREVRVLHQATNGAKFNPALPLDESVDDTVFVGGARPEASGRPIVSMALEASAEIGLWGPNWSSFAPAQAVRGDFLAFDDAPTVYRSAGIVLNDHWADMAQWGFINNRTFDAVAAGTPVISDYVEGLEMFDGAVVPCADAETMAKLLVDRSWQPSRSEMDQISARVRTEHSFAARAGVLLDDIMSLL